MFLRRALKRKVPDAEITEAENGAEVIAHVAASAAPFDLIALDKEMPVRTRAHKHYALLMKCAM